MISRRMAVVSLGAAAVTACTPDGQGPTTGSAAAASGSAPAYTDPLQGLYNIPAAAVPNDVAVDYYTPGASRSGRPASRAVLTMAVVPGANVDRVEAYLKAKGGNLETTLTRIVDVLKERYPWIELMDDLKTAGQRNVSLTLVVDVRAVVAGGFGDSSTAEIDVIVFDEQRKPISRLLVEGRGRSLQDAVGQALTRLDDKARTYLT